MGLKDFALAGLVAAGLMMLARLAQVVIAWLGRPKTSEERVSNDLESSMVLPQKPEVTDPEVLAQNHEFLMQDAQDLIDAAHKAETSRPPAEIESEFHKNFGKKEGSP